jgi:hypothetical protein
VSTKPTLILPLFHDLPLPQIPDIHLGPRLSTQHPQLAPLAAHERQVLDPARLSAVDRRDQLTGAARAPLKERDLPAASGDREHAPVGGQLCLFQIPLGPGADEESFPVFRAAAKEAFRGTKAALGAEVECVVVWTRAGQEEGGSRGVELRVFQRERGDV